jgi:hypothetical protein
MSTNTLVVRQHVWMESGMYGREGKVVKITARGVEVELLRAEGPIGLKYQIRFDTEGKACDSSDIYEGNMWGGPDDFFCRCFCEQLGHSAPVLISYLQRSC